MLVRAADGRSQRGGSVTGCDIQLLQNPHIVRRVRRTSAVSTWRRSLAIRQGINSCALIFHVGERLEEDGKCLTVMKV